MCTYTQFLKGEYVKIGSISKRKTTHNNENKKK
jgi:hypothetical protein